jgi:hypothetical protein
VCSTLIQDQGVIGDQKIHAHRRTAGPFGLLGMSTVLVTPLVSSWNLKWRAAPNVVIRVPLVLKFIVPQMPLSLFFKGNHSPINELSAPNAREHNRTTDPAMTTITLVLFTKFLSFNVLKSPNVAAQ